MMSKKAFEATCDEPASSARDSSAAVSDGDTKVLGAGNCPVCGVAFGPSDVIPILAAEADRELRRRSWPALFLQKSCSDIPAQPPAQPPALPLCACRELEAQRKSSKTDKSQKEKRSREEHVTSIVSQVLHAAIDTVYPTFQLSHIVTGETHFRGGAQEPSENSGARCNFCVNFQVSSTCSAHSGQPFSHRYVHRYFLLIPLYSKSTGILGHSEGAHWGGAQGYRCNASGIMLRFFCDIRLRCLWLVTPGAGTKLRNAPCMWTAAS
jgi:hypothetical protein